MIDSPWNIAAPAASFSAGSQIHAGNTRKQITEAVAGFESVLLREWLRQVRSTSLSGEDQSAGKGYLEMVDDQMAAFVARQGGMGLSRQLADQLLRQVNAAALIEGGDVAVKRAASPEVKGE